MPSMILQHDSVGQRQKKLIVSSMPTNIDLIQARVIDRLLAEAGKKPKGEWHGLGKADEKGPVPGTYHRAERKGPGRPDPTNMTMAHGNGAWESLDPLGRRSMLRDMYSESDKAEQERLSNMSFDEIVEELVGDPATETQKLRELIKNIEAYTE